MTTSASHKAACVTNYTGYLNIVCYGRDYGPIEYFILRRILNYESCEILRFDCMSCGRCTPRSLQRRQPIISVFIAISYYCMTNGMFTNQSSYYPKQISRKYRLHPL